MTDPRTEALVSKDTRLCISLSGRPSNIGTRFHNRLYRELGLDYVYKAFTTTDIEAAIAGVRGLGIRGCAVSMPWKEDVIPLVDEVTRSAAAIESVNTIVNDDGRLVAYNTDYLAIGSLLESHGISPELTFAVLGSGGMAKAAVAALTDAGFSGHVVARNRETGPALASRYGLEWVPELDELRPQLLLNATPVGMADGPGEGELAAPREVVEAAQVVFDVVAFPAQTPLVALARELGREVITGAEVIALQAAEQFVLYTGVRPSDEQVRAASEYSRSV